ncbi:hypothetical protein RBWH47_01251 [Rhodopirellula baltica WH47]|uniref:Uncharacterized protein n=1 Tax=Rhodopirellula baltica WH47 TaxID=991778 RepID=F2AQM3_RHOBT|nr:hypothetical protein RBWH47_01251 [Rhodopirellula baltica WH47]
MVVIHWGWLDAMTCVAMSLVATIVDAILFVTPSRVVVVKPPDVWHR